MRIVIRVFLALALVLALAAAAGYAWLRLSLAHLDRTLTLSGLKPPLEFVRDRRGVAHIYAGSARLRDYPAP